VAIISFFTKPANPEAANETKRFFVAPPH